MTEKGWVRDQYQYSWLQTLGMNVIKIGSVPKHVAVIMDGNRRFAKQKGVETIEGHTKGFDKLAETLQWCRDLGVQEVTVYAFSIENFKRSEKEVNSLLKLAKEKFEVLISEEEKLRHHGVRVKIIGNITYLPVDLQDVIKRVESITEKNEVSTLNVAFSYTSREEITNAAIQTCKMVVNDKIKTDDIDENLIESLMYTKHSSNPDLLIRTSGETRLSDFLLWQASDSITYFTPVLWPEFSFWHLLSGIFFYQRQQINLDRLKKNEEEFEATTCSTKSIDQDTTVMKILGSWWFNSVKTE